MTRRGPTGSRRPKANQAKTSGTDWRGEDPNLELEKSRYADPIASRELLLKHLAEAPEPLTAARLAKRLGLHTAAQREALGKRLAAMVRDGQAIEGPNGFATAGEGERVAGRVRGRANGDVLVMPDDGSAPLVLARADTATLMHGDRVEVLAVGMNERGRRIARLIRRIGDAPLRIGGIWRAGHDRGQASNRRIRDIGTRSRWPRGTGTAPKTAITSSSRSPSARKAKQRRTAVSSRCSRTCVRRIWRRVLRFCGMICRRNFLRRSFALRIALLRKCRRPTARAARIFANVPLVTIDGEDARDFDDAVYAEAVRGGGWRLIVAIADVSNYVRCGSELDAEARSRATSVYFPDRVIPMLPENLSNHLCSLMPRVERLAFVCDMRISKNGKPGKSRFYEAVIRSHARLTYDQAWATCRTRRDTPAMWHPR